MAEKGKIACLLAKDFEDSEFQIPCDWLSAAGYSVEGGAERDLRDSVGGVLFSGTNDIQRNTIAKMMGL